MFSISAKNVPVAFDFDLFRSSFRVEQTNGILFPAMRVCRFRLQPFFAVFRKWHDEPEIGLIFSSGIQVWKQKRDVHEVEWFSESLQQSQDSRSANGHAHHCWNFEPFGGWTRCCYFAF